MYFVLYDAHNTCMYKYMIGRSLGGSTARSRRRSVPSSLGPSVARLLDMWHGHSVDTACGRWFWRRDPPFSPKPPKRTIVPTGWQLFVMIAD